MKTSLRRAAALVLALMMTAMLLAGCGGDKSAVKSTVKNFEKACQSYSFDGLLDCIDPAISTPIRSLTGLLGISDEAMGELLQNVSVFAQELGMDEELQTEDVLSTLKIKVKDCQFNDAKDKCTATCTVSYKVNGEKQESEQTIDLVKVDDSWYIG